MPVERIGRAVLELTTDGTALFVGIDKAQARLRSLGQTIKSISSQSAGMARMARTLSGRDDIAAATKLTAVIERLGGTQRMSIANQARANTVLTQGVQAWNLLGRAQTPFYQRMLNYAQSTQIAVAASKNLGAGLNLVTKATAPMYQGMQSVGQAAQSAIGPTAALSQNMGVMAGAGFLAARAAEGLIQSVAKIGAESVLTAARTQGLNAVAEYLGQQTGKTKGEVDDLIKALNRQGISLQESANLVIQLSRANLGLENAQKLATVAQNAAFISGMNSSDALDNIITGIITLQPRLLRTAGITVTFEQAEIAAAKAAGRTVESLTAEEKQVIALNEVLRVGAKQAGVYALSMQYVGKQLTSLPRFLQDAEASVGEVFLPALSQVVTVATQLLTIIREYPKTFVLVATAVTGAASAALLFAGGLVGMSAGALAGGIAILGLIGLLTNYIAKTTNGTYAAEKFAEAAGLSSDKITTEQRDLLKLAGTMHDAATAQELVAAATGRTSNQLSEQEKETIQSQVTWNNWTNAVKEAWEWYTRFSVLKPSTWMQTAPPELPVLPPAPDISQSLKAPKGMSGEDIGGLLVEGRDLAAAQREVANANRAFQAEVAKGGPILKYLVDNIKTLYVGVDIDAAEKAIAARVGVSAQTVRRFREEMTATTAELKKTPFARFKENLKQLTADLKSETENMGDIQFSEEFGNKLKDAQRDIARWGDEMKRQGMSVPPVLEQAFARLNRIEVRAPFTKFTEDLTKLGNDLKSVTGNLDDTLFTEEFGRRLEDAQRDLMRWRDEMKKSGVEVPAEVTAALLRLNQIDLSDWARKEAEGLASLTDSLKGLGTGAAEAEERLIELTGAALKEQEDLRNETAKNAADVDTRRLQHDVTMAQQRGASWQQLYTLERRLRERQLGESIRSANEEFEQRAFAMDKTTQAGIDAYNMLRDEQRAIIRGMVEDFQLGEQEKLDELKRMHSRYYQMLLSIKDIGLRLKDDLAGNLTSILFGMGHDPSGELRKNANDAKKMYDSIRQNAKSTFYDIAHARHDWLEAEKKAQYDFRDRMIDVWKSIKSAIQDILNQILKFFVESFIAGLIRGMAGAHLGERLGNLIRGGIARRVGDTAPGWLPWLIGGVSNQPSPPSTISKPAPANGGIVPLPPAPIDGGGGVAPIPAPPSGGGGGGGHSPTPPPISVASVGREQPSVASFASGGFVRPGVVQPAVLHGGDHGELVAPLRLLADMIHAQLSRLQFSIPPLQMPMLAPAGMSAPMPMREGASSSAVHIHQHNTIRLEASSVDSDGMGKLFDRDIRPRIEHEFKYNNNRLASLVKRAIKE